MSKLGIMHGRLLPPIAGRFQCFPAKHWREEFPKAAEAGLQCIEWIYEVYGAEENPIATDQGISEMLDLSKHWKVEVLSLCADYFMEKPLVRATETELKERLDVLCWLMKQGQRLGIGRMVIPFVDASGIRDESEMMDVVQALSSVLEMAEETGVELHLETSLAPIPFSDLLNRLPHPKLKANYDIGNSASLGYNPQEEFSAYGKRIGSVHIKDRVLNGGTVPLGTGNADFLTVFKGLEDMGYTGDFILQAARGISGEEVSLAQQNRAFFEKNWPIKPEKAFR